jgi:hypothetical protein
VKDWYLAEGGHEGLRKLWGEKPLNEKEFLRFDLLTFFQILSFLAQKPDPEFLELESKARKRTLGVLSKLNLESTLSLLQKKMIEVYQECSNEKTIEEASRQICKFIGTFESSHVEDDFIREHLARISRECMEASAAI